MDFTGKTCDTGTLVVFRLWNMDFDKGRNMDTVALMRQHFTENRKESERGIKVRDRLYLEYDERFDWPEPVAEEQEEGVFCYGLRDHFGILCDGQVVPCCLNGRARSAPATSMRHP